MIDHSFLLPQRLRPSHWRENSRQSGLRHCVTQNGRRRSSVNARRGILDRKKNRSGIGQVADLEILENCFGVVAEELSFQIGELLDASGVAALTRMAGLKCSPQ